jgi:hypothetical protein
MKRVRGLPLARVLAANAAAKPFNIVLLVGTMGAAVAVGGPVLISLLVALCVYAAACARTLFDADEADKVLTRVRSERKVVTRRVENPNALAPEIRRHLLEARQAETRIRDVIERAELPYTEVSSEVDGLVGLMEQSASRAQLLYDAYAENPPERVRSRLDEVRRGRGDAQLADALEQQLAVQVKVGRHLQRFYDEMERMVVELETIRSSLLSVSASTDAAGQRAIASDVRTLRDELRTVAAGMSEAFDEA